MEDRYKLAAVVSAQYLYDGGGSLVEAVVNGIATFYPGRHYNLEVDGSKETVRKFYAVGGLTVAKHPVGRGADGGRRAGHAPLDPLRPPGQRQRPRQRGWKLEQRDPLYRLRVAWRMFLSAIGEVRWKDGITPPEYCRAVG